MDSNKQIKYIPLNASETAVLHDTNTILPRDEIYKPLAELIRQACSRAKKAIANSKSLDALREHNAISIDGDRGTGKTAVLVNLKRYLELEHKDLLTDVHILNPIDPTLLEDGESLFLHIIVAAVLHDEDIKQAQRNKPEQSRNLNKSLEQLAHSLEAVDTQKERHGMDKVRAMYGNKQLADSVHEFFFAAAQLLEKKLLILPIDDVDTSLNLAFENLEIIRRYLTTPYVLPIVSGDRGLYHEVTWRDFHGRLIKDSTYHRQDAYITATELAEEYQRKVLPFPRRLTMPNVSRYWQWNYDRVNSDGKGVMLGNPNDGMPLANFISWLEIYLTGPVNGKENSRIPLPIPSIRALSQLVNHCSDFIPTLPNSILNADSELSVRRIWQMPTVPLSAIDTFQKKHYELRQQRKREYADAYKLFADELQSKPHIDYLENNSKGTIPKNLSKKLADYFRFEPKAGAIYLVLLAKQHWKNRIESDSSSIFDTPLFQPLVHNLSSLSLFDKPYDLIAWVNPLTKHLPEEWLSGIKSQKTILPYPIAEFGITSSKRWNYAKDISKLDLNGLNPDNKIKSIFFINLQEEHNFYTNAKQSMLLNIGRIFELIISSIVRPITHEDIYSILNRPPFYSTAALAPTKTLQLEDQDTESTSEDLEQANAETEEDPQLALITQLHSDIKKWRDSHNIELINLSPWLVYKVFNKVYSQVTNTENSTKNMTHVGTAINRAAHIFYATWSAFGSFEKGELFGLPNIVSTTNINPENLKKFESSDNFKINVSPFSPIHSEKTNQQSDAYKNRITFGIGTRSITYCLSDHPLKLWIDDLIKIDWPKLEKDLDTDAETFLRKELMISAKNITPGTIGTATKKISIEERKNILLKMKKEFASNNSILKKFEKICSDLNRIDKDKENN
ncbi:MAG: antiviral RADAR system adenosine triphosphatase RdrA [Shewanella sp.]